MKKILLSALVMFFAVSSSLAQDVILLATGEDLEVYVVEINTTEIKFRNSEKENSPVFSMLKSDAWMVRYENGKQVILKPAEIATGPATPKAQDHSQQAEEPGPFSGSMEKPQTAVGKVLEIVLTPMVKVVTVFDQPAQKTSHDSEEGKTNDDGDQDTRAKEQGKFWINLGITVGLNVLNDLLLHGKVMPASW